MRKFISLFVLFIVWGYNTHAQVHFGVKAAQNLSLDFFQSTKYQALNYTFSPGLIIKFTKTPRWGLLQIDVNAVSRDFQIIKDDNTFDKVKTQNIHTNFLSHFQFGKRAFKYGANVGPYISYLQTAQRNYNDADTSFVLSIAATDNYSPRIDYGITGGLSFTYQFFFGDIQLDANFSLSYSSLTVSLEDKAYDFRNNQLMQVSISYLFCPSRLKKHKSNKRKSK